MIGSSSALRRASSTTIERSATITSSNFIRRSMASAPTTLSSSINPVVINGGGIGGLTLALALTKVGMPVKVYERSHTIAPGIGSGIGLWGPALMALRSLGLYDELLSRGKMMDCAGYKDQQGRWLLMPSYKGIEVKMIDTVHTDQVLFFFQLKTHHTQGSNSSFQSAPVCVFIALTCKRRLQMRCLPKHSIWVRLHHSRIDFDPALNTLLRSRDCFF